MGRTVSWAVVGWNPASSSEEGGCSELLLDSGLTEPIMLGE